MDLLKLEESEKEDNKNDIKVLKEKQEELKNYYYEEKTKILFELVGSFYQSYSKVNKEIKSEIIKKLLFELSINTKKELQIKENPLLESSKMLKFFFGTL